LKSGQKWRSTLFDFKKWRPTFAEKHNLRPILEVTPKTHLHDLCGRKLWAKGAQKLFGKVWGNSGKNLSHPKKFACSYTYELLD